MNEDVDHQEPDDLIKDDESELEWNWDKVVVHDVKVPFSSITRWRRGWVTIYKFENGGISEWSLWLPYGLFVGFQFRSKRS